MSRFHIISGLLALSLGHSALGAGLGTHGELANRALTFFDHRGYSNDYAFLLQSHPQAFQAGAPFPDWGYACGYHDAGEDAHWQPFMRTATQYIYEKYPQPWDDDTEKLVTFLLGVTAHSISDISWHGLGVSEGFLNAMAGQDFNDSFGDAHNHGDAGGDMIAARELRNDWLMGNWYVPTDDLVAIYQLAGHDVSPRVMEKCVTLLFLGTAAEKVGGTLLYPYFANGSPFLVEQFLDYFVGGLDDMAIWTAWAWRDTLTWVENGATDNGETYWSTWQRRAQRNHPTEVKPEAITLAQTMGLQAKIERTGRGISIHLDDSSIPKHLLEAKAKLEAQHLGRPSASPSFAHLDSPYTYLGRAMAAGDFNGDGFEDTALGAHGLGDRFMAQRGGFYLHYGNASGMPNRLDLPTSPEDESDDVSAYFGAGEYERLGWSMAVLDFNHDGFDDLAVSSPTAGARQMEYHGRVDIYFGGAQGLSTTPNTQILSDLTYENFGFTLRAGDVDRDGFDDLLIGAPFSRAGGHQRGSAYIYVSGSEMGSTPTLTLAEADWQKSGAKNWAWFGHDMRVIQPDNGPALLLISAPTTQLGDLKTAGSLRAHILGGGDLVSAEPLFTLQGTQTWDKAGLSFDYGHPQGGGPGYLALSTPTRNNGETLQSGYIRLVDIDGLVGDIQLDETDFYSEFWGEQKYGRLGWQLRFADLNGDGHDDLVAGEPYGRDLNGPESGALYVWMGGERFPVGDNLSARSTATHQFSGQERAERFGETFAFSDLNQDGTPDLLISGHRSSEGAKMGGALYKELNFD